MSNIKQTFGYAKTFVKEHHRTILKNAAVVGGTGVGLVIGLGLLTKDTSVTVNVDGENVFLNTDAADVTVESDDTTIVNDLSND